MAASLLAQLSDEFSSLAVGGADRVVQVAPPQGRPATGTVFGADLVLTAGHTGGPENGWEVRNGSGGGKTAQYLGGDPATGLSVLRVPGVGVKPLEPAADARVGELVLSLGRTWSGALAVGAGVVSVIGGPLRTGRGRSVDRVLRADVRVHPLGAGGPLLDASGRAAGIATGAYMRGGPLFIPAAIAWRTAETIVAHGGVPRGYLGISAQPVRLPASQRGNRREDFGLLVVGVADDSPAARADVMVGDLLVAFDGRAVAEHEALLSLLTSDRVGTTAALDIIRGGEPRTVQLTVGART